MKDTNSTSKNSTEITIGGSFWTNGTKTIAAAAQHYAQQGDPLQMYAAASRLSKLADAVKKEVKGSALKALTAEGLSVAGGRFSVSGGGFCYQGEQSFGHWDKWQEARENLEREKERAKLIIEKAQASVTELEVLMKSADSPGATIFHEDEQVPPAKKATKPASFKYQISREDFTL